VSDTLFLLPLSLWFESPWNQGCPD